ncbi:putative metalloprotease CJM1_0395 family protein [Nitrogeniibacter aestuarii]|uniref:putative metalloprotease CJM1_0395 family protein n=1 Tax=Nitrogeniibacter aestuarii TaxID=2815343 RepID=UPI001D12B238|nr:putative metalloprotease CJM1_0395 family protein [Nitrogeniibacter aestuarii]
MISSLTASAASYQVAASRPDLDRAAAPARSARPADDDADKATSSGPSVEELAATDTRVRAHEAAHLAASGGLAQSGANFDMVKGPDGKMYAVGGEVQIDVSPGRTPEETIRKADQIRRAAMAPVDPSAQDYRVAAQAAQMQAQAQQELARQGNAANGADGATSQLSAAINAYTKINESAPSVNLFA